MNEKTQEELDEFLNDDSADKMKELGESDDLEGMLKLMLEVTNKTIDLVDKMKD